MAPERGKRRTVVGVAGPRAEAPLARVPASPRPARRLTGVKGSPTATMPGRHAADGHAPGLTDRAQPRERGRAARQRARVQRSSLRHDGTHNRREARQRARVVRSRLGHEAARIRSVARQRARARGRQLRREVTQDPREARQRAQPMDARAEVTAASRASSRRLPDRTSRYNVGGVVPRIRNSAGGVDFALMRPSLVYDGGGRRLAIARAP